MTCDESDHAAGAAASERRTATVSSRPADGVDPHLLAGTLRPDNTAEMETRVEDGRVVTTIRREATGGLRSTLDDYVVNLTVATEVAQLADRHTTQQ